LSSTYSILLSTAIDTAKGASITAIGSDGFTLTWATFVGNPNATGTINYVAFR
jgi:hypothetical protein